MNSTIASNDSTTSINQCFAKWGLHNDYDVPPEIEFDLTNQVSLRIGADICGILGDIKSNSGTIRTDCLDATADTSKSILPTPINYLIKRPPKTPAATNNDMQLQEDVTNTSTSSAEDVSTSGNDSSPKKPPPTDNDMQSIEGTPGAPISSGTEDLASDDILKGSNGD